MAQVNRSTATPDLASTVFSMLSMSNHLAAPASLGHATPAPARALPVPPFTNDEATIAAGHAERRLALAQRRAEQQLTAIMSEASRLGTTLSVETLARTAIAAYVDTLAAARR